MEIKHKSFDVTYDFVMFMLKQRDSGNLTFFFLKTQILNYLNDLFLKFTPNRSFLFFYILFCSTIDFDYMYEFVGIMLQLSHDPQLTSEIKDVLDGLDIIFSIYITAFSDLFDSIYLMIAIITLYANNDAYAIYELAAEFELDSFYVFNFCFWPLLGIIFWDIYFILSAIPMSMIDVIYFYLDSFFYWLEYLLLYFKILIFNENTFLYFFILFVITSLVSFSIISYLGTYGIFFFNLIPLLLFWLASINLWVDFLQNSNKTIIWNFGTWAVLNMNYKVQFLFYIDLLSFSYMLLTTSIAVFVFIYAFSYFRYEPHVDRLLIMLNLFVISMIILVLAGNFVILFLGWELIGLTSFFLINFWNTRQSTVKSAFKAFTFNRISDVVLFFLCIYTFFIVNDCTISVILDVFLKKNFNSFGGFDPINVFAILIIIPVSIKSAQLLGHIWLPDSMEAPVPASALIHSATLVSAGIYLLLRFKVIISLSLPALSILVFIGSITAVYGAITSCFQTDVKRLLAYSTISHCGFLVLSSVLCSTEFTILYLYVHGFFKAASFICIGNVIRFNSGNQDIRYMGGFALYLPFEANVLAICLLFLAGAPFTFGFFMKHFLVASLITNSIYMLFIYSITFIAAVFGIIYCSRLYYGIFFGSKRSYKSTYLTPSRKKLYESDALFQYYTNSTFSAILAILGLMICGLTMCFILILFIYTKYLNFGDISSNQHINMYNTLLSYTSYSLLFNFGFINTVMLLVIFFICFVNLMHLFKVELLFDVLATIIIFLFMLLIFISLIF